MSLATLDDSQRAAASVTPETRQIVLAGPGAGKSEVVGALAAELVGTQDLYPEQILVISFSRAAVGVVEERTADVTYQGEMVEVRTIDSLAAQIVDRLSDDEREFHGYDRAIAEATRFLRASKESPLDDLRHVIVDEVQDVVGLRAEFVLALLEKAAADGAGFTLLGDPLQSLYDFQLDDAHKMTTYGFLETVARDFGAHTIELTGEYRSRSRVAARVAELRSELMKVSDSKRLTALESACAGLSPLGDLDSDSVGTIGAWKGRTALLCDTNARAAVAAAEMAAYGLHSETAAGMADRALPAWIALALAEHRGDRIDEEDFFDAVAGVPDCPDPQHAWQIMRDRAGVGSQVDIRELAIELGTPRGRNLFRRAPGSSVVVSTVHRAKGLEFDNVVLVDPDEWIESLGPEPATPMLYVAMSRGRDRVTSVEGVDVGRWRRSGSRTSHGRPWLKRSWRGKGLLGVLMEPWMARVLGPVDTDLLTLCGRPVIWQETDPLQDESGDEVPSWLATVDGMAVARTGHDFGRLMHENVWGDALPGLVGGRIDGCETVTGPTRTSQPGRYGLWMGARISGPIDLEWK